MIARIMVGSSSLYFGREYRSINSSAGFANDGLLYSTGTSGRFVIRRIDGYINAFTSCLVECRSDLLHRVGRDPAVNDESFVGGCKSKRRFGTFHIAGQYFVASGEQVCVFCFEFNDLCVAVFADLCFFGPVLQCISPLLPGPCRIRPAGKRSGSLRQPAAFRWSAAFLLSAKTTMKFPSFPANVILFVRNRDFEVMLDVPCKNRQTLVTQIEIKLQGH